MKRMALPNGTFTLTHKRTGEHRTVRIMTQSAEAKFAPGQRIIELLTGPNNERDYEGFGFVSNDCIHVWRKKLGTVPGIPSKYERLAGYLTAAAMGCSRTLDEYDLDESRRCIRCNRKLTDPVSIDVGMGPTCREK
jgi:hypothetical protein